MQAAGMLGWVRWCSGLQNWGASPASCPREDCVVPWSEASCPSGLDVEPRSGCGCSWDAAAGRGHW